MMSPDRMRRIDFWVGVPLCFLATLVDRCVVRPWRRRRADPGPPRNVLLVELAEMGSAVLAMPAIERLKRRHPDCALYFLAFRQIAAGISVLDVVPESHVLTLDASSLRTLARDVVRFVVRARRVRIDTAINLEAFARLSTLLAYASGATRRVGFYRFTSEGLYTGRLFTHEVPYNAHLHTARSFVSLVSALDEPDRGVPRGKFTVREDVRLPRLAVAADARARAQALLRAVGAPLTERTRLVLVNPNASKLISLRKWPLEHYAELVQLLLRDPDVVVGLTGVESERDDAAFITGAVRSPRVVTLTGRTTLDELLALYDLADLLVTNDSGPAHYAALTGIDIIVFFGPETPALYGPLSDRCTVMYSALACSPCVSATNQRVSPCTDNVCLRSIAPDAVYARARQVLEARAHDRRRLRAGWRDGADAEREARAG